MCHAAVLGAGQDEVRLRMGSIFQQLSEATGHLGLQSGNPQVS